MRYRYGAHGHGLVTKALHRLTVAAIPDRFLVGHDMDFGDTVHVAAQFVSLGAVAGHVGLVLTHTVVRRNRHLARML